MTFDTSFFVTILSVLVLWTSFLLPFPAHHFHGIDDDCNFAGRAFDRACVVAGSLRPGGGGVSAKSRATRAFVLVLQVVLSLKLHLAVNDAIVVHRLLAQEGRLFARRSK